MKKENWIPVIISNEYGKIHFSKKEGTSEYFISSLFVLPIFRRKGHARKLMEYALTLIEKENPKSIKIEAFSMELNITNKQLVKFYQQFGFTVCEGNEETGYLLERLYS